ncbi:MAG: transcriptional repressor [Bacteroidales bacterium]|nr:transcriptional repressor [Bacteroidales bacterium]
MKVSIEKLRTDLAEKGLKVTPQRMNILDAIYTLGNHPTAENIIAYIHKDHPNIATGTVYKVLDTLVENNLIKKVKTDRDIMRYDGVIEKHHHLYCSECDLIEDYVDEELDAILKNYFENKKFPGFTMEDIVLQIRGTFDKC